MHIHDWSIKKKLLLSHFLMIGIPVLIVMVVILGILFSFLLATGRINDIIIRSNLPCECREKKNRGPI